MSWIFTGAAIASGIGSAVAANNSGGGGGGGGVDLLSPKGILGLGTSLWSMLNQNKLNKQYNQDITNLMADTTGIASQVGPETLDAYDASAQQQLGTLGQMYQNAQQGTQDLYRSTAQNRGGFLRDLDTRARDLLGGYQNRYDTAARDIEGYGRQMAADIDTQAERERAEFALNPLSRGSTIGSSVNANITERRNAEQRRLGEDLVRQRVGLLSGLSGDQLAAQGGLDAARAAFDSALRGQLLDTQRYGFETGQNALGNIGNFYGSNAINRSGLVNQGMNTVLNTLMGMNLVPPAPNQIPAMMGPLLVDSPNYPTTGQMMAPQMMGGTMNMLGQLGSANILANAMGGGGGGFGVGGGTFF